MSGSTSGRKKDDEEIDNSVHYADDGTSFPFTEIFDADVAEEMLSAFAQKSSRSSRSRRRRSSSSSSSSSHREEEGGNDDDDDDDDEEDDDDNEDAVCLLGANLSSEKRTKNQKTRTLGLASTNRTLRLCPRDTQRS